MCALDDYSDLDLEPGRLDVDDVLVRTLHIEDLDAVVRIDEASTGISRKAFYKRRIERSLAESSIHLSMAAELDDMVVGFITMTFYQGEFGLPDSVAVLDGFGVHPDFQGRKVAKALIRQVEMNLRALHVDAIRTQLSWNDFQLMTFFAHNGFQPSHRIVLEKKL